MRGRPKIFRETELKTDCDACGGFFDLMTGGVCEKCRRVLCTRHLHGSVVQRVMADIRGTSVCVECRRGG